jgi:hypothetical protein
MKLRHIWGISKLLTNKIQQFDFKESQLPT